MILLILEIINIYLVTWLIRVRDFGVKNHDQDLLDEENSPRCTLVFYDGIEKSMNKRYQTNSIDCCAIYFSYANNLYTL